MWSALDRRPPVSQLGYSDNGDWVAGFDPSSKVPRQAVAMLESESFEPGAPQDRRTQILKTTEVQLFR